MDEKIKSEVCDTSESLNADPEVRIEGKSFKFNKRITEAITHFHLRSLNTFEKRWEVQALNISSEIFTEFLDTIQRYNENELWTTENLLELWDAARVLQNPCLIRSVETKVGDILSDENFVTIYTKAKRYQSHVLCVARSFLQRLFAKRPCDMGLTRILTYEDFSYFLREGILNVNSEDIVLRSIFEWAENCENQDQISEINKEDQIKKPLDRKTKVLCKKEERVENKSSNLSKLLKSSRYGTASLQCLEELSKHPLCEKDQDVKLVFEKAISYKLDSSTHGYWPPYAMARNDPDCRNVGVLAEKDQVSTLILEAHSWVRLPICPLHELITNVTVFDNELYVVSRTNNESLLFLYRNDDWTFVADLPGKNFIVVSKGIFIYAFDSTSRSVKCVSPRFTPVIRKEIKFPALMRNPESALDFDKSILIFCSTDSDERSAVISLDVPGHEWTYGGGLKGSAKNLVGFRNETTYFILQNDGTVSQIVRNQDGSMEFIFIEKLWSISCALRGAFLCRDILYIFSNSPTQFLSLNGIMGLFYKFEFWCQDLRASNFVQYITSI
ncbi:kelch protein 8 [Biomphalaria glabrata]|nr:kelch protein 8 [Biomphalaria glabrata]